MAFGEFEVIAQLTVGLRGRQSCSLRHPGALCLHGGEELYLLLNQGLGSSAMSQKKSLLSSHSGLVGPLCLSFFMFSASAAISIAFS